MAEKKIRVFNAVPGKDGVVAVSLVETPAHESNFEAFEQAKFRFADVKKQVVTGALLIPDKLIFRKDGEGNPYYLKFSKDAIETATLLFHKNKFTDVTNENHTDAQLADVYMFESTLISSEHQIAHFEALGLGTLPVGTWVGSYKVENKETFGKIESGELNGFSVEMFLSLEETENFYKIDITDKPDEQAQPEEFETAEQFAADEKRALEMQMRWG